MARRSSAGSRRDRDLDAMIVAGASPFPAPFALGHEGVAEVLDVGDGVETIKPGDRVLVPFQISCGTCARRRRADGQLRDGPARSDLRLRIRRGADALGRLPVRCRQRPICRRDARPSSRWAGAEIRGQRVGQHHRRLSRGAAPHLAARRVRPCSFAAARCGSIGLYTVRAGDRARPEDGTVCRHRPRPSRDRRGLRRAHARSHPGSTDTRFPITIDANGTREGLRWRSAASTATASAPHRDLLRQRLDPAVSATSRCT